MRSSNDKSGPIRHNKKFYVQRYYNIWSHKWIYLRKWNHYMWNSTHIILGCNEINEKVEDDNKNINGEKVIQYKEEQQLFEPEMEVRSTNKMAPNN